MGPRVVEGRGFLDRPSGLLTGVSHRHGVSPEALSPHASGGSDLVSVPARGEAEGERDWTLVSRRDPKGAHI